MKKIFIFLAIILSISACFTFGGFGFKQAADPAPEPIAITKNIPIVIHTPSLPKITLPKDNGRVYDVNNNQLYYFPDEQGLVFSKVGIDYEITHDGNGCPISYDVKTENFKNSKNEDLQLVLRSLDNQSHYLQFGNVKVRSVGITDKLYKIKVYANTAYNSGAAYDKLFTRVTKPLEWWEWITGSLFGIVTEKTEYYDLKGQMVDPKYIDVNTGLMTTHASLASTLKDLSRYWGTLGDALKIIELAYEGLTDEDILGKKPEKNDEIILPSDPAATFYAFVPKTGAILRDDHDNMITVKNNQLFDIYGDPLLGADARPLYFNPFDGKIIIGAENPHKFYLNHSGEPLTMTIASGSKYTILKDGETAARSIRTKVLSGLRIWYFYLADGKTVLPAYGKENAAKNGLDFYDFNDKLLDLSDRGIFVPMDLSQEDMEKNYDLETAKNMLSEIMAFFTSIGNWFDGIKSWFGTNGGQIVMWVLIIAGAIVFLITAPLWIPLLGLLFKALASVLKGIFKGIKALATAIFNGVKVIIGGIIGKLKKEV